MTIDTEVSSNPEQNRQLTPAPSRKVTVRSSVEMDGVSAAWLLFQFSRQSKEQKASHTIRTLLPNGALKVVNIEVECFHAKKTDDGKKVPVGLPGAFAQDIFIALMDHLVNQIRENNRELMARAQTAGLKGVSLPPSCTEVYFRNKDLAQTMQMSEKNARITDALEHLHKTHIKIRGCIYRDGQEEQIEHDTYYIPSLTVGKRIRGGMDKIDWQRAKFDDVLVKEILHGYIAQMDTHKLLLLPSGAPRKLYTLLAAKILERKGQKTVVITTDEIISTLRIKKRFFKTLSKRYFADLIQAGIIADYSFSDHKGVDVVVFGVPPEKTELPATPAALAADFFAMARDVALKSPVLGDVLGDSKRCDLDKTNLAALLKEFKGDAEFDGRFYPKPILWADMLIYNVCKGQQIKSVVGLLKSLLKKDKEPTPGHGFQSMDSRYRAIQAKAEAVTLIEESGKAARLEDAKVREMAQKAWGSYTESQRDRLRKIVDEVLTEGEQKWLNSPGFIDLRAVEVIELAINHGLPTGDVSRLVKWYREWKLGERVVGNA